MFAYLKCRGSLGGIVPALPCSLLVLICSGVGCLYYIAVARITKPRVGISVTFEDLLLMKLC